MKWLRMEGGGIFFYKRFFFYVFLTSGDDIKIYEIRDKTTQFYLEMWREDTI